MHLMVSRSLLVLLIALTFLPGIVSAQDSPQVSEVNPLSLSSGASARIFPSPDARLVVYDSAVRLNSHVDRYLTISTVEPGDEPDYYERPEELPRGFDADPSSPYVPFGWSPDSARVAVTGQPLVTLTDTDMWIFDIANESWTNLAEDNYSGSITEQDGQIPAVGTIIDQQPTYSPDGTTIAVERTLITDAGEFGDPQLTLVDAETGEARDLTAVPGTSSSGAVTAMDWSADGASLAVTLLHREPDAENDGLWLIDTETGEASRALTLAQIEDAVHEVIPELQMTSVGPVFWSPDSTSLLLWAGTTEGTPAQVWPFVVDVTSGEIASAPVPAHPRDSATARGLRPLQAAWSPDSASLLIFAFGLHPDEDHTSLDPANESVRGGLRNADLATGESQLLGYLPLGVTPFYYAEWSSDGDVIIDGYHLVLE
jgi:dipeptidyl aminopeptidase/acylaminoacyl peptidase